MNEKELDGYLKTLLKHRSEQFSEWEDGFIRSLEYRRFKTNPPEPYTDKQAKKLDEIAERLLR